MVGTAVGDGVGWQPARLTTTRMAAARVIRMVFIVSLQE
jgi:hypothetical protein